MTDLGAERRFPRRRFVTAAASGAAALALPAWLRPGGGSGPVEALASAGPRPFECKLPIPDVLTDSNLRIPIKKARVQFLDGPKTDMWTYGGSFPGPTIRRPSGEETSVTFVHRLGQAAGELTTHLHGGHNTSDDDGQPGGLTSAQPRSLYCDISPGLSPRDSGNDLLIEPGAERTYVYGFMEDGSPERAAMHWYHDHRLDNTGENVWRGLAGMWITDDNFDAALPLPTGKRDLPLMLTDRSFDKHNQLIDPFGRLEPPDDGVRGRYVLVNGAILPHHRVSARRYRVRILNASNFRAYNLRLSKGVKMVQIATESGLIPAPLERPEVLIGPGERVELVIDFAEARGKDVVLESTPRAGAPGGIGSSAYKGPIMQFRVSDKAVADDTSVPDQLRPLPDWTDSITSPMTPFTWSVQGGNFGSPWKINGRTFDPAHVEQQVVVGDTVVWRVVNGTAAAHLMHFHQTDWYMLERNGSPPPPHENCLKETFFMDPGDTILIAGKLSDHLGKFVVHCHMIDHEDHGLMSQFEVVSSPAPPPPGP